MRIYQRYLHDPYSKSNYLVNNLASYKGRSRKVRNTSLGNYKPYKAEKYREPTNWDWERELPYEPLAMERVCGYYELEWLDQDDLTDQEAELLSAALVEAIKILSQKQQAVLQRVLAGESLKDIARSLKMPYSSLRHLLFGSSGGSKRNSYGGVIKRLRTIITTPPITITAPDGTQETTYSIREWARSKGFSPGSVQNAIRQDKAYKKYTFKKGQK